MPPDIESRVRVAIDRLEAAEKAAQEGPGSGGGGGGTMKILRRGEVVARVGLSGATLYRLIAAQEAQDQAVVGMEEPNAAA